MALIACPFCRELFELGEARHCPVCGLELRSIAKLPLSHDAEAEHAATAPEAERLPWTYAKRGRGALPLIAALGGALFFSPWIIMHIPDERVMSGLDLARRLGWSWGAAIAWFVIIPTVLSRRSLLQLWGARVAAAFLSAVPLATTLVLRFRPPPSGGLVPLRFTYGFGLYGTAVVSIIAVIVALRLGGAPDDITLTKGSSKGETLH